MNRPASAPQLNFAIIGCGLVGRKRAAALSGTGSLLYACDTDPARAADVAAVVRGARATTDLRAVLGDDRVDAVIVATPNDALGPITLAAIRAGKHVLVEKPGALNSVQLRALQSHATKAKVRVRLGYNHRFHPALHKARALIESGDLGDLMFLRGRYGHGGRKGYEREWRADPARAGGGELIDQGVHLIDLAVWFLGDVEKIEGHAATLFWDMKVDDNAFVSLRTKRAQTAWLHVSCTEWKNLFSLELYGRCGKIAIDGLGGSYGPERLVYYRMPPEMGPPEATAFEFPVKDGSWRDELRAFCEDIQMARTPVPGLAEGIRTLEIVETIYRQSGFPVSTTPL
jgi:predicted dehydrogenase